LRWLSRTRIGFPYIPSGNRRSPLTYDNLTCGNLESVLTAFAGRDISIPGRRTVFFEFRESAPIEQVAIFGSDFSAAV